MAISLNMMYGKAYATSFFKSVYMHEAGTLMIAKTHHVAAL